MNQAEHSAAAQSLFRIHFEEGPYRTSTTVSTTTPLVHPIYEGRNTFCRSFGNKAKSFFTSVIWTRQGGRFVTRVSCAILVGVSFSKFNSAVVRTFNLLKLEPVQESAEVLNRMVSNMLPDVIGSSSHCTWMDHVFKKNVDALNVPRIISSACPMQEYIVQLNRYGIAEFSTAMIRRQQYDTVLVERGITRVNTLLLTPVIQNVFIESSEWIPVMMSEIPTMNRRFIPLQKFAASKMEKISNVLETVLPRVMRVLSSAGIGAVVGLIGSMMLPSSTVVENSYTAMSLDAFSTHLITGAIRELNPDPVLGTIEAIFVQSMIAYLRINVLPSYDRCDFNYIF